MTAWGLFLLFLGAYGGFDVDPVVSEESVLGIYVLLKASAPENLMWAYIQEDRCEKCPTGRCVRQPSSAFEEPCTLFDGGFNYCKLETDEMECPGFAVRCWFDSGAKYYAIALSSTVCEEAGKLPNASGIKAGLHRVGPGTCAQLGVPISNATESFGLTGCGLTMGEHYVAHVYVEAVDQTGADSDWAYRSHRFMAPQNPVPHPRGPFCFDIDAHLPGSEVIVEHSRVRDALTCQALCAEVDGCKHFQYVQDASLPGWRNCSLMRTDPSNGLSGYRFGVVTGPKDCKSRSVNNLRPRASRVLTEPSPAVRMVPFILTVIGHDFDQHHDRLVVAPLKHQCGSKGIIGANGSLEVAVNGSFPRTLGGWASLPCNVTGVPSSVALMACGHPPESVVFNETVGPVKVCICDAGGTPYGCDFQGGRLEDFSVELLENQLDVTGPTSNYTRSCPARRPCRIEGLAGYKLSEGDMLMVREQCSPEGRPTVRAYTNSSKPSPPGYGGGVYEWDEPNSVVCAFDHVSGPCGEGRMCYCSGAAGHTCDKDGDFLTDVGLMKFYGVPQAPPMPEVIQEDYRSFTVRWLYPLDDGGGAVRNYTLYFRICPVRTLFDDLSTTVHVPVYPGENRRGLALNGTHQFRRVLFGNANYIELSAATRYCVRVSATNDAGEGGLSDELTWVTDVHPPTDLHYNDVPPFLERGVLMASLLPTVTTQDCRALPSVSGPDPHYRAEDCDVQVYNVQPDLPPGLSLNNLTGEISGSPLKVQPRPEIYFVTATNTGGKSTFLVSLSVIAQLSNLTVSSCLNAFAVSDVTVTFRTPRGDGPDWYAEFAGHPQALRIAILDVARAVLYRSTSEPLGVVLKEDAVPCGILIVDVWSSSPTGFPQPTVCYWNGEGRNPWVEVRFQGGSAAFVSEHWYQLVLRMAISQAQPVGTSLLRLTLVASEGDKDERGTNSELFGVWTPEARISKVRPALSSSKPVTLPTPLRDAPLHNDRPTYFPGYTNPLLGEAPMGFPWPQGFPPPMITECINATTYCPTSPHQFVNTPADTAWHRAEGWFPGFVLASGTAMLQQEILGSMTFAPFGFLNMTAFERQKVALGNKQPLYVAQQEFQLDFMLSTTSWATISLERDVTVCPSSPLHWPPLAHDPRCVVSEGPKYVTCFCESTMPERHPLARCDRIGVRVMENLELRSQVVATMRVESGTSATFPGFVPIRWYVQVKSKFGGVYSFKKTENAGLDVAPDDLLEGMTPESCAEECMRRLAASEEFPVPCASFRFHRNFGDCYLSQYTVTDFVYLREQWMDYDNYEFQPQQAFAVATPDHLFFPGRYLSQAVVVEDTFLDPPEPSRPPFDVPHFFPSYVRQLHLLFAVELVPVVPLYGLQPWDSRLVFAPPPGFKPVALQAYPRSAPTPQGLGYCAGGGTSCSWFLSQGQALWPGGKYKFAVTLHNPEDRRLSGAPWYVQVISAGISTGAAQAALEVEMPHPLPVDGWLSGCSAHFASSQPVLPSGHLAAEPEDVIDIYFVVREAWRSSATLEVLLPEAFPVSESCSARPLTPWLDEKHLGCTLGPGHAATVRFEAPLQANAAIGLRLTPFRLPSDFTDVHPGLNVWPQVHDTIPEASLNIRLRVLQPGQEAASDACHPAVWSCGLFPLGWASPEIVIRPSRFNFTSVNVSVLHGGRTTGVTWASVEFVLPTTISFTGGADEALLLAAPFGYSLRGLHDANLQVLRLQASTGQLNFQRAESLADVARRDSQAFLVNHSAGLDGAGLRVTNMYGTLQPGERYYVNVSVALPSGGATEPALLDPTRFDSGRSACANVWGLALTSGGEHLASSFARAEPLAYVAALEVSCTSRALAAESNLLTLRFVTTERALPSVQPPGTQLVLVFSLPASFQLVDPAVAADFAAPHLYNRSTDRPTLGSERPEMPAFTKLGCPELAAYSRGRILRARLSECAVFFNNLEDAFDLMLVIDQLPAAAEHQLLVQVRNPPVFVEGINTMFGLSAFRTVRGLGFWQIPVPAGEDNRGTLVSLQTKLETTGCFPLLPAMQGEVHASHCLLDGMSAEVTIGFIAPVVMQNAVGRLQTPVGYRWPWTCPFNASNLALPSDGKFEYIGSSAFKDCEVSSDGRTVTFRIEKVLKAVFIWSYFTVRVFNPSAADVPATPAQAAWSLLLGGFASVSIPALHLRVFRSMELRELPFVYNATSWALMLRFHSATSVPPPALERRLGYVVLRVPRPFVVPAAYCRGNASSGDEPIGSPLYVPAMPVRPFHPAREHGDVGSGSLPSGLARADCSIEDGGLLVVRILEGRLEPGFHEWRFPVVVEPASAVDHLMQVGVEEGPFAPMRWNLESWATPAAGVLACTDCCPERRPNFQAIVGAPELELLDRGVLEAYPIGRFHHRKVVRDDYGGWRFSGEGKGGGAAQGETWP